MPIKNYDDESFGSPDSLEGASDSRSTVMINGLRYRLDEEMPEPTDEEIRAVNERLSAIPDPPRPISRAARIRILFGDSPARLFGLVFGCVGLLLCFVFFRSDSLSFHDIVTELGGWKATERTGTLAASESASFSFNGSDVYRHRFSVGTDSPSPVEGVCYSFSMIKTDKPLSLEESKTAPGVYRIRGTTFSTLSLGQFLFLVLFLSIFPLSGAGIAFGMMPINARRIGLLRNGTVAMGKVETIEDTNISVNNIPLIKVTFVYETAAGEQQRFVRRMTDIDRVTDEPSEILFCHRHDTRRVLLLDELPKGVRLDPKRGFVAGILQIIPVMILTALFLAGAAVFLYSFFSGKEIF